MKVLRYTGRLLRNIEDKALALFMFGMFILVAYAVVVRYLLAGALPAAWSEVLVRLVLAGVAFFGSSLVEREQGHFKIDIVVRQLGRRARLLVTVLADLIVIAFLLVMSKEALVIVPHKMQQFSGSWPILPLGLWPLLILIMAVLMFVYICFRLVKNIREVFQQQ
ncbi:TRAP transporter small permease [Chloroflexota bacterium]